MLTMKDFVPENDPILRKQAKEVSLPISDETRELATKMREFLINSQDEDIAEKYELRAGVGVAAPQIGVDQQLTVIYLADYDEDGNEIEPIIDETFINPQILKHSVQKAALRDGEGCLSVPRDVPGLVARPKIVTVRYINLAGETVERRFRNYEAIVVQHEIDHLKGVMFYDHINDKEPWEAQEDWEIL